MTAFFIFDVTIPDYKPSKTKNMKKNHLLLSAALLLFVAALSSCGGICYHGSGKQATETRKTGAFKQIDVSGNYVVRIKQDSSEQITIMADDNLLKHIITRVEGDKLRIYSKKGLCNKSGQVVLQIGVRHLNELSAAGAIEVAGDGTLNVQDFALSLSGISKVALNLNAANVKTDITGSGEISLTGQATSHAVTISGNGTLNALDFVVNKYTISTSGNGNCKINVLNELNVSSRGSSNIQYRGNPTKISNDKAGASSLTKIN
jgi:hypothetical protein